VLHTTRSQLVQVGSDARRHLKALIVTAPDPLRQTLRRRSWLQQARACAALQAAPSDSVELRATVQALRLTAQRLLACGVRKVRSRSSRVHRQKRPEPVAFESLPRP